MADAGPASGFSAANPLGFGALGGGPPGSGALLSGGAAAALMPGAFAGFGGAGPSMGFGAATGPFDMTGAFAGGSVGGIPISTATPHKQTNALVAFTTYFGSWRSGWERYIKPGTLLFPVKNARAASAGGTNPENVVELGGAVRESVAADVGQRFVPASIPIINWLLEESARNSREKRLAEAGRGVMTKDAEENYERRAWAYIDTPQKGEMYGEYQFSERFVELFGRRPMLEVNAYDDNPLGSYDPIADFAGVSRKRRMRDYPRLVAVGGCDGYVCETPNIWGAPDVGCKLSLRLRYFDNDVRGYENPYPVFMTPDGRRAEFGRTETGFLQLWPCVYSPYGGDPRIDPHGAYCLPHNSAPWAGDRRGNPLPTDLDWMHRDDDGVPHYQRGLEIFVGTVKEKPEAFDIVDNPLPLRNHDEYNALPTVKIILGV
jgi:hypothetical protein